MFDILMPFNIYIYVCNSLALKSSEISRTYVFTKLMAINLMVMAIKLIQEQVLALN